MGNPLLYNFGQQQQQPKPQSQPQIPQQPNSLFDLFNTIRNSQNPNQAMQNVLVSDPRFKDIVEYIKQNGGDARTACYNLAAQKGIDPRSINPEFILNQLK